MAAILETLTQQSPTFTGRRLDSLLARHMDDPAARERLRSRVLGHADTVGLSDRPGGAVQRYTTASVLEAEHRVLAGGAVLARGRGHTLGEQKRRCVLTQERFAGISREQARAVTHATGAGGLALIDGQAGTGKSFVLSAISACYRENGYQTIGLAPTNAVAQDLRAGGFDRAATLHAELFALERGRRAWDARTTIIVDEAAMIGTKLLGRLMDEARRAGAKLILAGDDRQLPSIERGGLFSALKARHGAATLTEVRRQNQTDERRASHLMADGKFRDALDIYAGKEAILWSGNQAEARAAIVDSWARDSAAHPDRTRFAIAFTNTDVGKLNAAIRALRKRRGELGHDHRFATAHGDLSFARGDRIQFTATAKKIGILNGASGCITAIDGRCITVRLDGEAGTVLSFDAAAFADFRHAYAGTVHRAQGRSYDQTYLLYSKHWQASPSYVALTRHRESMRLFVSRSLARDLPQLARQMARQDDRRAASFFHRVGKPAAGGKSASDGAAWFGKGNNASSKERGTGENHDAWRQPDTYDQSNGQAYDHHAVPGRQPDPRSATAAAAAPGRSGRHSTLRHPDDRAGAPVVPHDARAARTGRPEAGTIRHPPAARVPLVPAAIPATTHVAPSNDRENGRAMNESPGADMRSRRTPRDSELQDNIGRSAAAPGDIKAHLKECRRQIKVQFKAAVQTVTKRDPEAPQPQTRQRRRGEKESGGTTLRVAPRSANKPTARGRFAALRGAQSPKSKMSRKFSRAATDATEPEIEQQASLYLSDTLELLRFWEANAGAHQWQDVDWSTVMQDHSFPQL